MEKLHIKRPRALIFIIFSIIFIILSVIKLDEDLVERIFRADVMLRLKSVVYAPFAIPGFSVAEILIAAAATFVLCAVVYFIVKLIKERRRLSFCINFLILAAAVVMVVQVFFSVFCGVDYARKSLADHMGLETAPAGAHELAYITSDIARKLNESSKAVSRDDRGLFSPDRSYEELLLSSDEIFNSYFSENFYDAPKLSRPKPVVMSEIMNYLFIAGFYFPYTGEANINIKDGHLYLPVTACHEKAHQYGTMREGEANYLAFLICTGSGDDDFIYSGYIKAFVTLSNQLYHVDGDALSEIYSTIDDGVYDDLYDYSERAKSYRGAVSAFSEKINNSYLKSQGQASGVQSYGEMADLIIASYRMKGELDDLEG